MTKVFNLNYNIRVKLKPAGIALVEAAHQDDLEFFRQQNIQVNLKKLEPDAEDYYTFQGWVFLERFGPHFNLAANLFDLNILIEPENLTDYEPTTD